MSKIKIVSHSDQPFQDRLEAGVMLGKELNEWRGRAPVVLGIPRGGVVTAREVARAVDGDLDIALARKLRAPYNPELAIGSISEDGHVFLDASIVSYLRVSESYLEEEKARALTEIQRRSEYYRRVRAKVALQGRAVIVTDDGLATGATMRSALWAARTEDPEELICAVPVGSEHTVEEMADHCDTMVVLRVPRFFSAVSQFYMRFPQTDDGEVLAILSEAEEASRSASPAC